MNTNREMKCAFTLEDVETKGIINIKEQMEKIYSIWDGYHLELNIKIRRSRVVWNHIQNLLKDVYVEENTFYEMHKRRINNYKMEIEQLYRVLQMTPREIIVEGSWIAQEEMLSKELNKLTEDKNKLINSYQELKNEEIMICQKLNLQEHKHPSNTVVPSENDFLELKKQVKILNEEKEKRQMKFDSARKELMTILELIEFLPESPLEEEIISNKDILALTDDTFKALEEVTYKVQRRKEELDVKKTFLIESLSILWRSLEVPENKRIEFLSKHTDCRLSTFESIEQEIKKCKAIESGNERSYILSQQTELAQLWDKCYVSQPEREKFPYLQSKQFSIEVLEALKAEVDKWKKYYSKVEHILKKIDKRKILWDTLHVMENSDIDPHRFISSKRNLLKEYKERIVLQKDLFALQKDVFEDIESLKSKDGSTFLYNGEDFETYVANQCAERNHRKENKVEKLNKHSSQTISEAAVKTPLRRTSSINFEKKSQPKLIRSKTLYCGGNFKTHVSNERAKSSINSDVHKKNFAQKNKNVNFATPLKRTVTMNFSKTAPSKFFKSLKTTSPFNTPTVNRSKVVPSTVARMTSKSSTRTAYLPQKK